MAKATDEYPWIVKYGRMLGSFSSYIDMVCETAREDGAPKNAICKDRDSNRWMTTDDIKSNDTRRRLGLDPWPTKPMVRVEFIAPAGIKAEEMINLLKAKGVEIGETTRFAQEVMPDKS